MTSIRVASVTVGARTTTTTYDSAGRVVSVEAPTGTVGYADFDALGRPRIITLPGGRVVTQAYDPNGNVTTVTPPSGALPGNAHAFGFTLGNKLASYTPPLVSAPAVTTYTYDRDELLKQILSPLQPALSPEITRDLAGRVIKVTEGTRERTFTYDKGHVVNEAVTGVPDTVTLARTYGRSLLVREGQEIGIRGTNELMRGYDDLLRVTSQWLVGGPSLQLDYDADGLLSSVGGLTVDHGSTVALLKSLVGPTSGWSEQMTYDGYGAPLTSTATIAGFTKGGWTLEYDAAGRIWRKTETPWGPGAVKTWTYGYDPSGRLSEVTTDGGAPAPYLYDANGNRQGAMVDAQDRVTSQDGTHYAYDAHGNVLTRTAPAAATQTLSWDSEGGLLSVTKPGADDVAYVLDARGRRVGKKLGGTLVREWMYDGQLRVIAEVVRSPVTGVATQTRVYGYVPERHLPVVMVQKEGLNTTTYRIYGDHLGSLRRVVRTDGTEMQRMEHGPWGEVLAESVTAGFERVPFGFAGGLYDAHTGLVRFGAREYDAGTGRWLSKDEARFGGGWNFYEYANSNPVHYIDLTGRGPREFVGCLFAGGGLAACWDEEYERLRGFGPEPTPVPPTAPVIGPGVDDDEYETYYEPPLLCTDGIADEKRKRKRRKKKSGCYCVCITTGYGPVPEGRVRDAAQCANICASSGKGSECK